MCLFLIIYCLMGIINQGILGGLRKKVGSVVGASWKGIPVLRIYQPVVANPKTAAQVTVRNGFKGFAQLASLILASFIKPLWDRGAVRMSGYNAFLKANAEGIAAGDNPFGATIVATKGKMDKTTIASVSLSAAGLTVTWDGSASNRYALPTDLPFVLVMDDANEKVLYAGAAPEGVKRSDGTLTILPAAFMNPADATSEGKVYLSFMRADGSIVSDSDDEDYAYSA